MASDVELPATVDDVVRPRRGLFGVAPLAAVLRRQFAEREAAATVRHPRLAAAIAARRKKRGR